MHGCKLLTCLIMVVGHYAALSAPLVSCFPHTNQLPSKHVVCQHDRLLCVCFAGTLPPSWGAHAKLRVSRLWNNKLSGPLPASWSEMAAIEDLQMSANNLAGTVPPSWGSWGRVKTVALWDNPQLSGCLPAAWRRKVNIGSVVGTAGPYKGQDLLTAGTGITGFC